MGAPEIVSAAAWPVSVTGLGGFALFLFRKQIRGVIEGRGFRLKAGPVEIEKPARPPEEDTEAKEGPKIAVSEAIVQVQGVL